MNYQKVYDDLIAKCQARQSIDGYKERHHIIPKSLGGSNDPSNLVDLTAREHFVAHFLLAKMHGGNQWLSIKRMRGNDDFYINSRLYEVARREVAKATSLRFKGVAKSAETRAKMSAAARRYHGTDLKPVKIKRGEEGYVSPIKGVPRETPWMVGRIPTNKGVPVSDEARKKMSEAGKGKKNTPEHLAKRMESRRLTRIARGQIRPFIVNGVQYEDSKIASSALGVPEPTLKHWAYGKGKPSGKYAHITEVRWVDAKIS
jgi:hypothetical protein